MGLGSEWGVHMSVVGFKIEIRKEGAQSLRTKMRIAELYLKRSTVIYRLAATCRKIVRTSDKVEKHRLLTLVL